MTARRISNWTLFVTVGLSACAAALPGCGRSSKQPSVPADSHAASKAGGTTAAPAQPHNVRTADSSTDDTPARPPDAVAAADAPRDAALWPFSADSPWNTSLGSGAEYTTIDSPGFSSSRGANLNVADWSYPVFIATPNDAQRKFYWRDGKELIATIRAPDDARQDPQADGSLLIINDARDAVVEMWQASRLSNGDWEGSVTVKHDLRGSGFYNDYRGIRAGGMAALGGLIRRDELINRNIPHALAVAVRPKAMNRRAPGRKPFVWPASWADGGDGGDYAATGNLHMGSLLAIPPDVDIDGLGLSPQGLAVARALQDYGAYIVDQGGGNIIYYAEPASADILRTSAEELGRLTQYLKVVANNSKSNVGGGGKPRRAAPSALRSMPR